MKNVNCPSLERLFCFSFLYTLCNAFPIFKSIKVIVAARSACNIFMVLAVNDVALHVGINDVETNSKISKFFMLKMLLSYSLGNLQMHRNCINQSGIIEKCTSYKDGILQHHVKAFLPLTVAISAISLIF